MSKDKNKKHNSFSKVNPYSKKKKSLDFQESIALANSYLNNSDELLNSIYTGKRETNFSHYVQKVSAAQNRSHNQSVEKVNKRQLSISPTDKKG